MGDRGVGEQPHDVGLRQRRQVAPGHRDGREGREREPPVDQPRRQVPHRLRQREDRPDLGDDGEVGRHGDRPAVVGIRCPEVEGGERRLVAEADQDGEQAGGGERGARQPAQVRQQRGTRPGEPEGQPEDHRRAGHRAEDEVLQRRLGRPVVARVGDQREGAEAAQERAEDEEHRITRPGQGERAERGERQQAVDRPLAVRAAHLGCREQRRQRRRRQQDQLRPDAQVVDPEGLAEDGRVLPDEARGEPGGEQEAAHKERQRPARAAQHLRDEYGDRREEHDDLGQE